MLQKPLCFGISTACLYPMETEKSLELLGGSGVKRVELFLNDFSEYQPPLSDTIREIQTRYGIEIPSVHSCLSPMDHFWLFHKYPRRAQTLRAMYRQIFAFAQKLGASYLIFHGNSAGSATTAQEYAAIFSTLCRDAEAYGVQVLQENVVCAQCGDPDFFAEMLRNLPPDHPIAFDCKQSNRFGIKPTEFANRLLPNIRHVHLSSCTADRDCLIPFYEDEALRSLLAVLGDAPQLTGAMIEVYRDCFTDPKELLIGCDQLQKLWAYVTKKEFLAWNQKS